ncbi:MAG TPA: hypothetical protein VEB66_01185 [Opitutaceae bacterium]|nr:hypothetical protein [Opitutaceae bacterium]
MKTSHAHRAAERGGCSVKLIAIAVLLLVLAVAAWVLLLPRIVASTVRSRTGFELAVDRLWMNPFTANVSVRGAVLRNPEDWPLRDFVELREFKADVKLFSLFGDRLEAEDVVVNVAKVTLVRDRAGVLNAVKFKDGFVGAAPPAPEPKPAPAPAEETKFFIKRLHVKVDRIIYADHSRARPAVRDYPVNIDRELTDVDTVAELISPLYTANVAVVTEALGGMFEDSVEMLKGTSEALKDASQKATDTVKGFLDKLKPKN